MKLLLCAVLFSLAAGCATTAPQRDATEAFGLATERVGRMGESEFVSLRNGIIRMHKFRALLDSSVTTEDILYDVPADIEKTAEHVSACKSLRFYGDLLMRLASDDRTQFVRRSAIVFMDSVSETLGRELTPEQKKAGDNVIASLDSLWTENRKSACIRGVVLAYEQAVNTMADNLLEDLSREGTGHLWAYDAAARGLQKSASAIINEKDKYGKEERRKAISAYFAAEHAQLRARQIGMRFRDAVAALKRVNAEIVSGVRGNGYDVLLINEYGRQIQQLSNRQQILQ